MKRLLQLLNVAVCGLAFWPCAHAQLIWNGPTITFTKADWADYTQTANQDHITPYVWLTRADNYGVFNINTSPNWNSYLTWAFQGLNGNSSNPADITAANYANLNFVGWDESAWTYGGTMVGLPGVLHLDVIGHDDIQFELENIYLDVKFTSWTADTVDGEHEPMGGGFSYDRATVPEPSAVLSGGVMGLAGLGLVLYRRRQTRA